MWWCYRTPSKGWGCEEIPQTKQSGHAPRSGSEIKNGSIAKDGMPESFKMSDSPGSELDPAVDNRRPVPAPEHSN